MPFPRRRAAARLLAALLLAAGCTRFDPVRARRDHTAAFTNQLARAVADTVTEPLTLESCVRLAMARNYAARQADLQLTLARLGRDVAFTAFLPTVAAKAGYTAYDKTPLNSERAFADASITIGLPLLMPSTWYLFAAQRQRTAIAETAAFYVRQGIAVQTAIAYYNTLIAQDTVAALESQLEAARETADRLRGLAGEGLAAAWEGDQAALQADRRAVERNRARRQLDLARNDLLLLLGLPAGAPIRLAGPPSEPAPLEGAPEDRVLKALEIHPELAMADREIVMRQQEVRQAFTAFLPTLSIFTGPTWTGNDLAAHTANWISGLTGAWTLFDGLANRARFKAAQLDRSASELAREETLLTIMVQVVAAEAALRNAEESAALDDRAFQVAEARWADYEAQAREGLRPLSDALDARAARDLAQVVLVQRRYQAAIARANLDLAMGLTALPAESPDPNPEPVP